MIGGRSLWGAFISPICKKYGWTFDYVMWEISYQNLRMMQLDEIEVYSKDKDEVEFDESKDANNPDNFFGDEE